MYILKTKEEKRKYIYKVQATMDYCAGKTIFSGKNRPTES